MNNLLQYITTSLQGYLPDDELRDTALWIAEEATGLSRTEILCKDINNIPNLEILLSRLRTGEPLQYVFGKTDWGGMTLKLSRATLIPRPETWELVELVAAHFATQNCLRVLDVGTGSGCIAIALKRRFPQWQVEACDISEEALRIAEDNARTNSADIRFFQCDILSDDIPACDLIVSNPPYVMQREAASMDSRVLLYEPHDALFVPDTDPLLFYRRIASMHRAPHLVLEINPLCAPDISDMLHSLGYDSVDLHSDMAGKTRFALT